MIEDWSDKLWAVMAAIISALGGFIMYERKKIDSRLTTLETDHASTKVELATVKESLSNLKKDTQEIKESQAQMLKLLLRRK